MLPINQAWSDADVVLSIKSSKKSIFVGMIISSRGIVFRTLKYGESSLILDIYTEALGLRSYIFSGVRSGKSRAQAAVCQLTYLLDIIVYEREDKELNRMKEVRPAYIYNTIPFDIKKSAVGLFMLEVARKTIRERERNPELFAYLWQQFYLLDSSEHPVSNLHLSFLLSLAPYLGFAPMNNYSDSCSYFNLREGIFEQHPPVDHMWFFDPPQSKLLHLLLNTPSETCHEIPISRTERQHLLDGLLEYYRFHTDSLHHLNTHQIFKEVLG